MKSAYREYLRGAIRSEVQIRLEKGSIKNLAPKIREVEHWLIMAVQNETLNLLNQLIDDSVCQSNIITHDNYQFEVLVERRDISCIVIKIEKIRKNVSSLCGYADIGMLGNCTRIEVYIDTDTKLANHAPSVLEAAFIVVETTYRTLEDYVIDELNGVQNRLAAELYVELQDVLRDSPQVFAAMRLGVIVDGIVFYLPNPLLLRKSMYELKDRVQTKAISPLEMGIHLYTQWFRLDQSMTFEALRDGGAGPVPFSKAGYNEEQPLLQLAEQAVFPGDAQYVHPILDIEPPQQTLGPSEFRTFQLKISKGLSLTSGCAIDAFSDLMSEALKKEDTKQRMKKILEKYAFELRTEIIPWLKAQRTGQFGKSGFKPVLDFQELDISCAKDALTYRNTPDGEYSFKLLVQPTTAKPPPTTVQYNTAAIRELLTEAFNDSELTTLCSDYFRAVYQDFSIGMSKGDKVQRLLDYATRNNAFPNLLALVKKDRHAKYAEFESRLIYNP